jgi:signal transduction histidine kinase
MPQPWFELGLAVALTAGALLELTSHGLLKTPGIGLAAAVTTAAIAIRFRWPLVAVIVAFGGWIAETALGMHSGDPIIPVVAALLVIYAVGSRTQGWRFWAGGALAAVGMATQFLLREPPGADLALAVAMPAVGLLIGRGLGVLRFESDVFQERADALEREQDERIGVAIAAERSRIARELHDVIGHSISVMGLQAGAVRRRLHQDQQRERDTLLAVEQTGREAVGEMHRLLGLLRAEPDEISSPNPSLRQIDRLIGEMREAGLSVELSVEGSLDRVSPGPDLAGYRIVQEALTNVLKHAPASHTAVVVRRSSQEIELEVADDGAGVVAPVARNGHVGHGLLGMRERTSLYGGALTAGPRAEGGFRVHARIPLEER